MHVTFVTTHKIGKKRDQNDIVLVELQNDVVLGKKKKLTRGLFASNRGGRGRRDITILYTITKNVFNV